MAKKKQSIGAQMVALRYSKQTQEQRSEAARHAANQRWKRRRKSQKKSK